MEVAQVKFPVAARRPAFGIFRGQQQRQVKMLFVMAVREPNEIAIV